MCDLWASQVVLVVKKLPSNEGDEKTWVRSLGQEDPLEKETHSSILAMLKPGLENFEHYFASV